MSSFRYLNFLSVSGGYRMLKLMIHVLYLIDCQHFPQNRDCEINQQQLNSEIPIKIFGHITVEGQRKN